MFYCWCARHGAHLGGASPLLAPSMGIMSLCKGVHREVKSEEEANGVVWL